MGWATCYIAELQAGKTVSFRPRGNSMAGKIESGQLCTVAPVDPATLTFGEIVLCKVRGRDYLHLVKAIQDKIPDWKQPRPNQWLDRSIIYFWSLRQSWRVTVRASGDGGEFFAVPCQLAVREFVVSFSVQRGSCPTSR